MKLALRSRLAAMVLVIFLLAATIVDSAAITWRQVRSLRRRFSGVRIKSFRIADYLDANVLDLNATLLQFVLGHDPKDWQKFSLNAEILDRWLGQPVSNEPSRWNPEGAVASSREAPGCRTGTSVKSKSAGQLSGSRLMMPSGNHGLPEGLA
jgi:hypothetical protein